SADTPLIFNLVVKPLLQGHQRTFDGVAVHPEIPMPGVNIAVPHPSDGFPVELEFEPVSFPLFVGWLSAKAILNPPLSGVVHQANNRVEPLLRRSLQKSQKRPFPIHRRIPMSPIRKAEILMQTRSTVIRVGRFRLLDANRQQDFSRRLWTSGN